MGGVYHIKTIQTVFGKLETTQKLKTVVKCFSDCLQTILSGAKRRTSFIGCPIRMIVVIQAQCHSLLV